MRHPELPEAICGAVLQVRIGATTIDQRNMGDGGRPVRTLLTETRLGTLSQLVNHSLSYLALEPYIDASITMESNRTTIGDVLPLIERAYETSFELRALFGQLGVLVSDEAIEAVRAAFVRRFYSGRCRGIYLLASCLTLMGRAILQERAGRGSRPMAESVADKFRMSAMTKGAVELLDRARGGAARPDGASGPQCSGRALRCPTRMS